MEEINKDLEAESAEQFRGNKEAKMDLRTYIKSLGGHLLCEPEYNKSALSEALDMISSDIQDIRQNFTAEAPKGLEPVRDFMIESMDLYLKSVEDMRKYMNSDDREHIEEAMMKAEEAEDIMGAIESVIQEQMDWISDMTQA